MKKVKLGDVLQYEQPSKYIVENTNYNDKYKTPVLTAGKTFLLGYTNEKDGIYEDAPCIIFDDFTTATKYVNFYFKVKSSAMKILNRTSEDINLKYYFYLLQVINVDNQTHKRYWISEYSKLDVFLPTLQEQEKIVLKIEELLSKLDNGIDELNKAKDKLAVYRQAVLKSAFNGELIGIDICDSYLLKQFIEKPRYGTSKKCSYDKNEESIAVYRIPNINYFSGIIDKSDLKYSNFLDKEKETLKLKEHDILIIRSNGSVSLVGRASIVDKSNISDLYAGYLIRLRVKEIDKLNPRYLLHFLSSHEARVYIENTAKSTSGVNNINSGEISNLSIPICDIKEQKEIVQEIESKLSICDNIENVINESLAKSESLRQSILKKAFDGKLV